MRTQQLGGPRRLWVGPRSLWGPLGAGVLGNTARVVVWSAGVVVPPHPIPQPTPKCPHHSCRLTFLGIENAGLAQLAEEGAPAAGGLQVVQVEVGRVQPTGQVGEACKREKRPPETPVPPPRGLLPSSLPLTAVRPRALVLEALRFSASSPQQRTAPSQSWHARPPAVPGSHWDSCIPREGNQIGSRGGQ